MSFSQTELVELSDRNAESNVEDTLAQTPPKKESQTCQTILCFPFTIVKSRRHVMAI